MKKRSPKDRGGDLRSDAKQSIISNSLQIPFQGIAYVGSGRDRITITAGLGKGKGRASIGAKIRF